MEQTLMEAGVDIAGEELLVEYEFKITAKGYPASGPTHDSGGEPAAAAEFEITVHGARLPPSRQHPLGVEVELPAWLKDLIATHLSDRDDINSVVQDADRDPNYGRDPDYERDMMIEDRENEARFGARDDDDY